MSGTKNKFTNSILTGKHSVANSEFNCGTLILYLDQNTVCIHRERRPNDSPKPYDIDLLFSTCTCIQFSILLDVEIRTIEIPPVPRRHKDAYTP